MTNIFIFTGNVKLSSFRKFSHLSTPKDLNLFITTHMLFDFEKKTLIDLFPNADFKTFADFLTDAECKEIDERAYQQEKNDSFKSCLRAIALKNQRIASEIVLNKKDFRGFVLSDDLGVDCKVWKRYGFHSLKGDYYYLEGKSKLKEILKSIPLLYQFYKFIKSPKKRITIDRVSVAEYLGRKIIFIGKMNRISRNLEIEFAESNFERDKINRNEFYKKNEAQYLLTMHESGCNPIPDSSEYDVRFVQDGYLPPNYTALNLKFKPKNVQYYAWDKIGKKAYDAQSVPVEILPFRKKLYLAEPQFPKELKTVLISATCAGPWSALINPSDDDILIEAIAQTARKYSDITFIYRPHPACVHPMHTGVHTIARIAEYFSYLNLPNLRLSTNVPSQDMQHFSLTFSNTSLLEDIHAADLIISEYSYSLVEGAIEGKVFASVNLTNRRNFYQAVSDLGFPHCNSVQELWDLLDNFHSLSFIEEYTSAVRNYNAMLDIEE